MTKEEINKKVSSYLGFARRGGNVAAGAEQVISSVRRSAGKDGGIAVLLASDSSCRTQKQISDKCTFYKVFFRITDFDSDRLSEIIGKSAPVSAVAVTDKSLAGAIQKLYSEN